jgi:2,3-bisphosphoglycerate-dependent phosphoglycerate mutase
VVATTLLLARHGETDWNRERRWQGHADPPLNDTGRAQALALAEELRPDQPTAVYSSDLARSLETATIVAAALGLPVETDARLREVDVGEWSGLLWSEIEARYPDGVRRRLAGETGWERGEEFGAMRERVVAALVDIASAHPGGRVLVVTHGGPVVAAWLAAGGAFEERPTVGNGHVLPVRVEGGRIARID